MRRHIFPVFLIWLLISACSSGTSVDVPLPGRMVRTDMEDYSILTFCEDRTGYMWMATRNSGVFWYTGDIFVQYYSVAGDDTTLPSEFITTMQTDASGSMWVGTNNGIARLDYETGQFAHYTLEEDDNFIHSFFLDNASSFFVMTNRKLYRYAPESDAFSPVFNLPQRQTSATHLVMVDRTGKIWLRYDNHICCYDTGFVPVRQFDYPSAVNSFVYDGMNRLWFTVDGTVRVLDILTLEELPFTEVPFNGSVDVIQKTRGQELLFFSGETAWYRNEKTAVSCPATDSACPFRDELPSLRRGGFYFDSRGYLWIALPEGGYKAVAFTDTDPGTERGLLGRLSSNQVVSTATNGTYYWIVLDNGSIQTYDAASEKIIGETPLTELIEQPWVAPTIQYASNGELLVNNIMSREAYTLSVGPDGLPGKGRHIQSDINFVADIAGDGTVWASSPGGRIYTSASGSVSEAEVQLVDTGLLLSNTFSFPNRAAILPNGEFLIMQTDNHPHLLRSGTITDLCPDEPNWQIYYSAFCVDTQGDAWIGTNVKGLYHYATDGTLTHVDELGNLSVIRLAADKDGTVFAITSQNNGSFGIYMCHPGETWTLLREMGNRDKDTCKLISLPSGEVALVINNRLLYLTPSNDESQAVFRQPKTLVFTTGARVFQIRIVPTQAKSHERLFLKELPDNFNVYLSMQDYALSRPYNFVYNLNGFRKGFQQITNGHPIPLYDLSYGRNRLSFMFQDLEGMAGSDMYRYTIHIRRPFYHYLIITLFLLLAGGLTYLFSQYKRKQEETEKERRDREIQEKINEKNMEFFSNISHEFRSPLTVINGAVNNLETGDRDPTEQRRSIQIIRRNTDRMLKLISQLLDFNKLDNGMLKLHTKAEDLSELIIRVAESFKIGARQKDVDLEIEGCDEPFIAWIDADKVEKILYNLLSNAMKFTPAGGRISVSQAAVDGDAVVTVADTGIGIPEDMTEAIFNRFVQARGASTSGGTGVGLYYTRSLVRLHHGDIHARNRKNGDGSTGAEFTFHMPFGPDAYTDQEKTPDTDVRRPADQINGNGEYVREEETFHSGGMRPTVLLIDDDYEFVYYLKSVLSRDYNVAFRFDAMSGYKVIEEVNPDIIISDIMMVDVDGLQLCRMIKENILISHIPVIMLTARSTVEDQIQSLNVGADAYLTKPFNPDHLLALVGSMIANRKRIMALLASSTTPPRQEKKDVLGERDRDFIGKVYEFMESSLQDGELNIDGVVAHLGISRTKFFYKMKSLTGQTPNEFFNTYRLNYAAKLLKMNKYKVSAVAEMVGFGSSSHFTLLFKKHFGMLPSQYIDEG